jgi:hypothetical protein
MRHAPALTNDEAKAKKERQTRGGTYKSGMNVAVAAIDGGYTAEDLKMAASDNGGLRTHGRNKKNLVVCPTAN